MSSTNPLGPSASASPTASTPPSISLEKNTPVETPKEQTPERAAYIGSGTEDPIAPNAPVEAFANLAGVSYEEAGVIHGAKSTSEPAADVDVDLNASNKYRDLVSGDSGTAAHIVMQEHRAIEGEMNQLNRLMSLYKVDVRLAKGGPVPEVSWGKNSKAKWAERLDTLGKKLIELEATARILIAASEDGSSDFKLSDEMKGELENTKLSCTLLQHNLEASLKKNQTFGEFEFSEDAESETPVAGRKLENLRNAISTAEEKIRTIQGGAVARSPECRAQRAEIKQAALQNSGHQKLSARSESLKMQAKRERLPLEKSRTEIQDKIIKRYEKRLRQVEKGPPEVSQEIAELEVRHCFAGTERIHAYEQLMEGLMPSDDALNESTKESLDTLRDLLGGELPTAALEVLTARELLNLFTALASKEWGDARKLLLDLSTTINENTLISPEFSTYIKLLAGQRQNMEALYTELKSGQKVKDLDTWIPRIHDMEKGSLPKFRAASPERVAAYKEALSKLKEYCELLKEYRVHQQTPPKTEEEREKWESENARLGGLINSVDTPDIKSKLTDKVQLPHEVLNSDAFLAYITAKVAGKKDTSVEKKAVENLWMTVLADEKPHLDLIVAKKKLRIHEHHFGSALRKVNDQIENLGHLPNQTLKKLNSKRFFNKLPKLLKALDANPPDLAKARELVPELSFPFPDEVLLSPQFSAYIRALKDGGEVEASLKELLDSFVSAEQHFDNALNACSRYQTAKTQYGGRDEPLLNDPKVSGALGDPEENQKARLKEFTSEHHEAIHAFLELRLQLEKLADEPSFLQEEYGALSEQADKIEMELVSLGDLGKAIVGSFLTEPQLYKNFLALEKAEKALGDLTPTAAALAATILPGEAHSHLTVNEDLHEKLKSNSHLKTLIDGDTLKHLGEAETEAKKELTAEEKTEVKRLEEEVKTSREQLRSESSLPKRKENLEAAIAECGDLKEEPRLLRSDDEVAHGVKCFLGNMGGGIPTALASAPHITGEANDSELVKAVLRKKEAISIEPDAKKRAQMAGRLAISLEDLVGRIADRYQEIDEQLSERPAGEHRIPQLSGQPITTPGIPAQIRTSNSELNRIRNSTSLSPSRKAEKTKELEAKLQILEKKKLECLEQRAQLRAWNDVFPTFNYNSPSQLDELPKSSAASIVESGVPNEIQELYQWLLEVKGQAGELPSENFEEGEITEKETELEEIKKQVDAFGSSLDEGENQLTPEAQTRYFDLCIKQAELAKTIAEAKLTNSQSRILDEVVDPFDGSDITPLKLELLTAQEAVIEARAAPGLDSSKAIIESTHLDELETDTVADLGAKKGELKAAQEKLDSLIAVVTAFMEPFKENTHSSSPPMVSADKHLSKLQKRQEQVTKGLEVVEKEIDLKFAKNLCQRAEKASDLGASPHALNTALKSALAKGEEKQYGPELMQRLELESAVLDAAILSQSTPPNTEEVEKAIARLRKYSLEIGRDPLNESKEDEVSRLRISVGIAQLELALISAESDQVENKEKELNDLVTKLREARAALLPMDEET